MHTTRNEMPKSWPIERKGTKYIATSSHSKNKSIPLLFIIRDLLNIAKTKREAKQILNRGDAKVNGRVIKDERLPIQIADLVCFEKIGKVYKLGIENKKFKMQEVNGKEAHSKIVKIIGKKLLQNKKYQINLLDGQNIISDEKINVGDSVVLNLNTKKIEHILKLDKNCNIEIIGGKYAGSKGKLDGIKHRERGKKYLIKLKEKKMELPFDLIQAIE
jgi:small subunit ribosomal protein S4e